MQSPPLMVALPFSVFVVSELLAKLVHLYIHIQAAPLLALLFYLPTLFIPDILLVFTARLLLRRERSLICLAGYLVGCLLAIITFGASASQLGFFYETGGEFEWRDALSFASSNEGRQVLLSGILSALGSGSVVLAIAWFAKNVLYRTVGNYLTRLGKVATKAGRCVRSPRDRHELPQHDDETDSDSSSDSGTDSDSDDETSESHGFLEKRIFVPAKRYTSAIPPWTFTSLFLFWIVIAAVFRPEKPYRHMTNTLPVTLLTVLKGKPNFCNEQQRLTDNEWPLPDLIESSHWQVPKGDFKGWAPSFESVNPISSAYRQRTPDWLPIPVPNGFTRWDPEMKGDVVDDAASEPDADADDDTESDKESDDSESEETDKEDAEKRDKEGKCEGVMLQDSFYNPVDDPLKITNLDTDILEPVKEALDSGSVKIKHVVLILMESLREELFPIQQGSDIHRFIMESNDDKDREEINKLVSRMTPNIEKITGKSGNFMDKNGKAYDNGASEWDDRTEPGFGGINVVGGLTPCSVSMKSIAASHCGAWPMPVDMFEEAETEPYQPCLPQILDLFNQIKEGESSEDFREHKWRPAFYQSITDTYDRQDEFDEKIGFKETVTRADIRKQSSDDPDVEEINYFGFAENVLKSYIKDYVHSSAKNKQRMFLTHFTSTTHHPWETPDWFNSTSYMGDKGKQSHHDFDKYLNTIHFHDRWMGELMQLFDDLQISNETLVVFVGDHGQAFKEDNGKQGTYENGHISNFRVPITFKHPHLPRYQYEANATSVSILPTVLDLLINSGSLNDDDTEVASDIIHDYEGQSLIRPYKTSQDGRRAWNFGIVNSGGAMLTVTSADAPWRLILPLDAEIAWRFTDLKNDPLELDPLEKWSHERLVDAVKKRFGEEAAEWTTEAGLVAQWWALDRKRLWRYHNA